MKYAIILPDGAADEPIESLGGRTPLEAARIPHMDSIAMQGRLGRIATVPSGYLPGSDVATLSLFGYDPRSCYDGRAPLEAAAKGLTASAGEKSDDLIFRCNLVTIVDGAMVDFTAGHISPPEAERLMADLNEHIAGDHGRFHTGVSYRNLLIAGDAGDAQIITTPPHDIPDEQVADYLPRGAGSEWVRDIMTRAHEMLADHEVNTVRRDMGENPATDIWLWGQGRPKALQPFSERFGISGAAIAAVDLIRGIAMTAGLHVLDVPGATGYLDTDYEAKGVAAVAALEAFDLVIVHVEAPDEAGHLGNLEAKIEALERIDTHVVRPVLEKLQSLGKWRILVAPDHPTPVERRVHTSDPPPFCMAGDAVSSVLQHPFCEKFAEQSDLLIDPGYELMEFFLRK